MSLLSETSLTVLRHVYCSENSLHERRQTKSLLVTDEKKATSPQHQSLIFQTHLSAQNSLSREELDSLWRNNMFVSDTFYTLVTAKMCWADSISSVSMTSSSSLRTSQNRANKMKVAGGHLWSLGETFSNRGGGLRGHLSVTYSAVSGRPALAV